LSWHLPPDVRQRITVYWPSSNVVGALRKWIDPLRAGLSRHVRVVSSEIPQPYGGIALTRFVIDGVEHTVAIDASDYPPLNNSCLDCTCLYFKMQYSSEGYAHANVLPGGFVPGSLDLFPYLPHLRSRRAKGRFACEVYGRFSLSYATATRQAALERLSKTDRFRYSGGDNKVRYSRFLREAAAAKICVDLPGNGDLCFRLIDYLAVGTCIVGLKHRAVLHVPLVPQQHIAYVSDDLSDLLDVCEYYLKNEDERELLAQNSREYFDRYLRPEQLAAYYLRKCLDHHSGCGQP